VTLTQGMRRALPYLAIAALLLTLATMMLRRAGVIAETVVLPAGVAGAEQRSLRLVTVLPKDTIPAIFDPQHVSAAEGESQLDADDLVLGVSVTGEHRAYGVAFLSGHEVVNDVIGGRPLAVTW
jgi:hypothetical protein